MTEDQKSIYKLSQLITIMVANFALWILIYIFNTRLRLVFIQFESLLKEMNIDKIIKKVRCAIVAHVITVVIVISIIVVFVILMVFMII